MDWLTALVWIVGISCTRDVLVAVAGDCACDDDEEIADDETESEKADRIRDEMHR